MKKIISTTLVAVAVAVAMVGSVDAKVLKQTTTATQRSKAATTAAARRSTLAPAPVLSRQERTADANDAAAVVLQAGQQVVADPSAESKKELMTAIKQEANTPEMQETLRLATLEKELMGKIGLVQQEMKDLNYGFFGFRTSKETQDKYANAKQRLSDLKSELTKVKADMKANEQQTSRSWTATARYIAAVSIVIGAPIVFGTMMYKGWKIGE